MQTNKQLILKSLCDPFVAFLNEELKAPIVAHEYTFAMVNFKQAVNWIEDGLTRLEIAKKNPPPAKEEPVETPKT